MSDEGTIKSMLENLGALCPAGYAIALHIKFVTPTYLFQSYSKDWVEYYSKMGWMMQDPTVRWGFGNTGITSWDALIPDDTQGVFAKAAEYGLKYGFVFALETNGSRSISSFARSDRNYSAEEIDAIREILQTLHDKTLDLSQLSDEERRALTRLSVALTHG